MRKEREGTYSRRGDKKEEGAVVGDRLWRCREEKRQIYSALTEESLQIATYDEMNVTKFH